jgi:phosphatidylglycerophosphatase A
MPLSPLPPWPAGAWPRLRLILATVGFAGYARVGPGTAGSLAGLAALLALELARPPQPLTLWVAAAALTLASVWIGWSCTRAYNLADPSWFVLDEAAGMALALACGPGLGLGGILGAFVGFRLLDVLKPPPIAQLERLPGGIGITADDLLAGGLAGLAMRGLSLVFPGLTGAGA